MKPELQEFAASNAFRVKTGNIDITANQGLARRFMVNAIPTLMVFRDGKPEGKIMSGFGDKSELDEFVFEE